MAKSNRYAVRQLPSKTVPNVDPGWYVVDTLDIITEAPGDELHQPKPHPRIVAGPFEQEGLADFGSVLRNMAFVLGASPEEIAVIDFDDQQLAAKIARIVLEKLHM